VEEFRVQAERRGCRVEFDANGTVAPTRADREALSCVVWNLLDNAVKYSPDSRTVWLELGRENGYVAIRVRDQGVGIPLEEQARIFQKFVRGKVAGSLGVQGAGIGLAVAREIIATHGGKIKIDSAPGMGSTFTILLPERTKPKNGR
jgi:signal transduction histidine kinase